MTGRGVGNIIDGVQWYYLGLKDSLHIPISLTIIPTYSLKLDCRSLRGIKLERYEDGSRLLSTIQEVFGPAVWIQAPVRNDQGKRSLS